MAALSALRDVGLFLLALVGVVLAAALLLVGAVLVKAVAGGVQATGDGPGTATDNCPGCGSPVEAEGAHCSGCRPSAGREGTPAVVEGTHRR